MQPALILIAALVAVGLPLWLADRRSRGREEQAKPVSEQPAATGCDNDCCALHEVCPSQQMLAAGQSREVTYYDDQELDAFCGREAGQYADDEIEQFRDILLTLRPDDRAGWLRSVKRRGIALPAVIHDELFMLLREGK